MNLNNSTSATAKFTIDTSNGRVATVEVAAGSSTNEDVSKYRSPFTLNAIINGVSASPLTGLDGSQNVTLLQKGAGYMLMDSF